MKKIWLCVVVLLVLGVADAGFTAGKGYIGVQKWECHGCHKEFFTIANDDPMKDSSMPHNIWLFKATAPDSYIGACSKSKLKDRQHIFKKKGSVIQTHSYDFSRNFFTDIDKFIVLAGKGRVNVSEWTCDFCQKTYYSIKGDDLNNDYNKDVGEQRNHLFYLHDPGTSIGKCSKSLFGSEAHLFTLKREGIAASSIRFAKEPYKGKVIVIK